MMNTFSVPICYSSLLWRNVCSFSLSKFWKGFWSIFCLFGGHTWKYIRIISNSSLSELFLQGFGVQINAGDWTTVNALTAILSLQILDTRFWTFLFGWSLWVPLCILDITLWYVCWMQIFSPIQLVCFSLSLFFFCH